MKNIKFVYDMGHPDIKRLLLLLFLAFSVIEAKAQFFVGSEDPGNVNWKEIRSETYRVIYPEGLDSLARQYLISLELEKDPVSQNLGYKPNQSYSKPMPVVLHPFSVSSNGSVAWTPRRMDLVTTPTAYKPESTPWMLQLTLHESRHVAQMQYVNDSTWRKYLKYPFGEIAAGALSAFYCGPSVFEGDAVVTETALTNHGRGRSADFLEYMRACFTEGDMRDYYRWRYGSIVNYTPDYYKSGYISMAGLKSNFGFTDWPFSSLRKDIAEAFDTVADSLADVWRKDNAARGPFLNTECLTETGGSFTQYSKSSSHSEYIYSVREQIDESPVLVRIDPVTGEEKTIRQFTNVSSKLSSTEGSGRIYWSETVPDKRWPSESFSDIFYLDENGRIKRLTKEQRYYNPSLSRQGDRLSVTEYTIDARSNIVLLDALDGHILSSFSVPANLQVVETVWLGDRLFASATSPEGFGIYSIPGFKPVIKSQPVKIKELDYHEDEIVFICDRNGVDELYSINPVTGRIRQLTSTENGVSDYRWYGDSLYFSMLKHDGRMIYKAGCPSGKEIDFGRRTEYPMTETLTSLFPEDISYKDIDISDPAPYQKYKHLFHFHSWAPVYFKYNSIDDLSMSSLTSDAGLGATAFFQNELGTAYGYVAYSAWTKDSGFRNGGHAMFTYSGLFPKIELTADFNNRDACSYAFSDSTDAETGKKYIIRERLEDSRPSFEANLKVYVPFNFSSNGWLRGVIPQAEINFSNDRYYTNRKENAATFSLKARAYSMLRMATGRIYPKYGIGGELGVSAQSGPYAFYPCELSAFLYGYLPGFGKHGIKLSGALHDFPGREHRYSLFTLDYAIPFAPVEWSVLSPYVYVRNFEFTAHARFYSEYERGAHLNLPGIGASLVANLGNLLWIPYNTRIGISYLYFRKSSVNLVFSIEI